MNPDWRNRYETAVAAAREASRKALQYFDTGLAVEQKADLSPVTIADREAEQHLRGRLLEAFPADGFLGEESGCTEGSSGYQWIIDPIDGTRNYVRGIPIWGTLVGLAYKNELMAGVIEAPALGLSYRALRGEGAYRGESRMSVSQVSDLTQAQLFYSSLSWFIKAGCSELFLDLAVRTERQRGFGDFFGFMLVAQGSGELMVEHGVSPWDIAAVVPIVEESGGRFPNWNGRLDIARPDVLASNGRLHAAALNILGSASQIREAPNY